jgi:hypothetical protein
MPAARAILGAILALCLLPSAAAGAGRGAGALLRHSGMSDASAAVAVDASTFLVADDERNVLHAYRAGRPGGPLAVFRWDVHLGIDPKEEHPEVDIEGAARLGEVVYWISSHGRNRDGKWRPNRHRLFATSVTVAAGRVALRPFGRSYDRLALDLAADARLRALGLAEAVDEGDKTDKRLAPTKRGLNIESLCGTPDGRSLLIGFRNPRPGDKALLVPLRNPAAVLARGARAEFGEPILLDLPAEADGKRLHLGIRSIAYSKRHAAYVIVAGAHDGQDVFALYRWPGPKGGRPQRLERATRRLQGMGDFTPEAVAVYPHTDRIQVLSDDGTVRVPVRSPAECLPGEFRNGFCQAKHLLDDRRKTFRSLWLDPK